MKTKKFIEKVRDLGYSIQLENHTQYKWADITVDDDDLMERDKQVARISTAWEAWGDLYHMEFSGHNEIELLNVITEYLVTPLEEREEVRRYVYELPVVDWSNERLSLYKTSHEYKKLRVTLREDLMDKELLYFTDKEVEQYIGKERALFNACEKIEVTSND